MAQNTKAKYPNLRYKLMRGLISYERFQRTRHWEKQSAEWTSKAIVSLDFNFDSIKSVRQAVQLDGIGAVIATKLKDISKDKRYASCHPGQGKFVSSAPALLVALFMLREELGQKDMLDLSKVLIPEPQLRQVARVLSEEKFIEENDDKGTGFCQAWWRMNVLANRGLVKKRARNKLPVYELLPPGEDLARKLLAGACLEDVTLYQLMEGKIDWTDRFVQEDDVPRRPNPADDHLYTNDDGSDGLVLYVDIREWGGDRLGLNALCRRLEESGMRYSTRHLATGDYSWVWTCGGQKLELPVLVERKRADDLAESIKDGRYGRQKEKMLTWRQKYDVLNVGTNLTYVVEGEAAPYVVRCPDACQGVGKCGNPTVEEVQAKIDELDESLDFELIRTPHSRGTVELLLVMTQEIQERINNGDFFGLLPRAEDLEKAADNNAVHSTPSKPGATQKKAARTTKAKAKRTKAGKDLQDLPVWQEDVELRDLMAEVTKKRRKKGVKDEEPEENDIETVVKVETPPYPSHSEDLLRNHPYPSLGEGVMRNHHVRGAAYDPDIYAASGSKDYKPEAPSNWANLQAENRYTSTPPPKANISSTPVRRERSSPLAPHNFPSDITVKSEFPSVPRTSAKKKRRVHDIDLDWLENNDLPSDVADVKPAESANSVERTPIRQRWHSEPVATTSRASSPPFASPFQPRYDGIRVKSEPGASQNNPQSCSGWDIIKMETREAGVAKNSTESSSDWREIKKEAIQVDPFSENFPLDVEGPSSDGDSVEDIRDRDWATELRMIKCILPEANEVLAKTFLQVHNGNVDLAVSALLDSGT